jgi:hypothetical protein
MSLVNANAPECSGKTDENPKARQKKPLPGLVFIADQVFVPKPRAGVRVMPKLEMEHHDGTILVRASALTDGIADQQEFVR